MPKQNTLKLAPKSVLSKDREWEVRSRVTIRARVRVRVPIIVKPPQGRWRLLPRPYCWRKAHAAGTPAHPSHAAPGGRERVIVRRGLRSVT